MATSVVGSRTSHFALNFLPDDFANAVEFDFSDPQTQARYDAAGKRVSCDVPIQDVRGCELDFTLFRNGFQYVRDALDLEDNQVAQLAWKSEEEIAAVLVPRTRDLLADLTGAFKIVTAGYRLRNLTDDPRRQLGYHGPSHEIHCDFSSQGALRYLQNHILKDNPEIAATVSNKRFLVVNVWRPLVPIRRDPLAMCDWQSVRSIRQSSLVPWKVIYDNGALQNESLKVRYDERQKWVTLRGHMPSEPLVFLCFDSGCVEEGGMTVPHGAFVDPEYAHMEARVSFEIKFFCFLDE